MESNSVKDLGMTDDLMMPYDTLVQVAVDLQNTVYTSES
jgi:hypothetical protein